MREVLGVRFDVRYQADHVRKLLHQLGFNPRKPEQRAVKRAEQAIQTWGEQTLPRAEAVRTYQQSVFDLATRPWTPEERVTFARLFVTLMQAVADLRDEAGVEERRRQP